MAKTPPALSQEEMDKIKEIAEVKAREAATSFLEVVKILSQRISATEVRLSRLEDGSSRKEEGRTKHRL